MKPPLIRTMISEEDTRTVSEIQKSRKINAACLIAWEKFSIACQGLDADGHAKAHAMLAATALSAGFSWRTVEPPSFTGHESKTEIWIAIWQRLTDIGNFGTHVLAAQQATNEDILPDTSSNTCRACADAPSGLCDGHRQKLLTPKIT